MSITLILNSGGDTLRSVRRAISLALGYTLLFPMFVEAQPVVSVRAETRIELRVAAEREGVRVEGALRDDRGEALAGRTVGLTLSALHASPSQQEVTTGEDGGFSWHFRVEATSYRISARFEGEPGYRGETVAQDLDLARAHVRLGLARADGQALDRIDLDVPTHDVHVTAQSEAGQANLEVELASEVGEVLAAGRTDARGEVTLTMQAARLGAPAAGRLVVRTAGDATRAAAQVEMPVVRYRNTELELLASQSSVAPGEDVVVEGVLRDSVGPLPRRAIGIFDGAEHLTTVLTDDRGQFSRALPTERVGLALRARFASDAPWRPSAESEVVRVEVVSSAAPGWWWLLLPMVLSAAALLVLRSRRRSERQPTLPATAQAPPGVEAGAVLSRVADRADVGGVVLDADEGTPLAGARVVLRRAGGEHRAAADGSGAFRFATVEPGRWEVSIEAPGFEPRTTQVQIPHRGRWSAMRVRLRSLRQVVLGQYRGLAQALAPERKWWAFWTPRELARHAPAELRPAIADLTSRVEIAAYGANAPAADEVSEIGRSADELARRSIREDDQVSGQR